MNRPWQTTIIVVLVLLLTACGSSGSGSSGAEAETYNSDVQKVSDISGTVRVALAGWQLENGMDAVTGQETTGFNQYVQDTFKKMYPNITLEVTQVPWENAQAKQRALLMSGDVDVLYTGGAFASQYYNEGLLRNIDDLIKQDKEFDPSIYLQGIWNNSYSTRSPDGKNQYGIPAVLGKRVTIYDKQLFDEWGVEPLSEVPTPEEILEKAKKMTGTNPKTGEQNYGLYFAGNSLNQATLVALSYYFDAKGGEGTLDKPADIQWELNTPGMVKAVQWLGEAAKLAPPAFVNGNGAENFGLDKNNVAMVLDNSGTTIMSEYRANKDDALLQRYIPVMNMGPDGTGWVAVDPIIMAKKAENPEAAWAVMKFLASYDTQKWAYLNFDMTPTLTNADFVESNNGFIKNAMKMAEISKPTLMDEADPFYNSEIVPAVNGYISEVANGGSPDVQALLDRLQSRAEQWSASQK
ncbi:extracellular solute-binding protein [Paenibacillus kandeliae]|uniref:extracellular solute-binding protein n=1 Tax=Paenibacillus kandeliae TaxID=3231269 RepID=UPI003457EAFB